MAGPADNTPPCKTCGLQPQVRGCTAEACRGEEDGVNRPSPGPWIYNHVSDCVFAADGRTLVCDDVGYADGKIIESAPTLAAELEEAVGLLRACEELDRCPVCDVWINHAVNCKLAAYLAKYTPKET